MPFKTLSDLSPRGKRILVRVDLNVPVENGRVTDATRLDRIIPTIAELADGGGRVILLAHFGRPKGRDPKESLEPVAKELSGRLGRPIAFAPDCIGPEAEAAVGKLKDGEVLCLENTRFHAGEEKNDPDFVAALTKLGDAYVNDAFSAAHRAHASTEGLARKLPAYAGRTMEAELVALDKALGAPSRPVIAVVGGAKVSTKLDLLKNLVHKVDALVIGGGMANTFLHAQGIGIGKSLAEKDLADTARAILDEAGRAGCAIILPVDATVAWHFQANAPHQGYGLDAIPADGMILDVGPQSIERINAAIKRGDARLERPARRLRALALRHRHRGGGEACGGAREGRASGGGGGRRRHGGGAQSRRRRRRFQLRLDGGRRLPRMDGRQGTAGRQGAGLRPARSFNALIQQGSFPSG